MLQPFGFNTTSTDGDGKAAAAFALLPSAHSMMAKKEGDWGSSDSTALLSKSFLSSASYSLTHSTNSTTTDYWRKTNLGRMNTVAH